MKKTFTAAYFGKPDMNGDVIRPGAIKHSGKIPLIMNFENHRPISWVEEIKEQDGELKITADVPENLFHLTPAIGFNIVNQKKLISGEREITEMNLRSVGLVWNNIDPTIKPLKDQ